MAETTFIYTLRDPDTNEIRYAGKANDPIKRLRKHLTRLEGNAPRINWLRDACSRGVPVLEIVAEVPQSEWPMWEVAYIQFFKEEGCNLVNSTAGGEGIFFPTSELLTKMRVSHLGKKQSFESRLKRSITSRGINNPFFGKKHSEESLKKMSAFQKGKVISKETKQKMSAAHKGSRGYWTGKKLSDQTREKMRLAWINRKQNI